MVPDSLTHRSISEGDSSDDPGALCPTEQDQTPTVKCWVRVVLWLSNVHRRMLAVWFAILGPRAAYMITGFLARLLYRLLPHLRIRSEAQCRAALGNQITPEDIPHIARQSFVHRVWNLTDLMLAERYLHKNQYVRFGGQIPEPFLSRMLNAQKRKQPAILITGYYGPFDLLPVFLGYNGVRACVVYRRHGNESFDLYRRRIRSRSGCELIPVERATSRVGEILAAGGTVAIVADHHDERRGMSVTFLGLEATAMRSVGLLAWRYEADVVVAGIRRLDNAFRFEIVVVDIFGQQDWQQVDDAVAYITDRYVRGLEKLILGDPAQYLWAYARWGEDFACRLTESAKSG